MRRTTLALAVLLALAPSAHTSMTLDEALSRVRGADTLTLSRLDRDTTVSGRRVLLWRLPFRVAGLRTIAGEPCRALAGRIAGEAGLETGHDCWPVCLKCANQLFIQLDFPPAEDSLRAVVAFRERTLRVFHAYSELAFRYLGPDADSLFALVRRALPEDRGVGTASPDRWPALTPDRIPGPDEMRDVEELPEAVTRVAPQYPEMPRTAGIDGTVQVWALVGEDGRVAETRVARSIPGLDEAAGAAIRQWVFHPARCGGRPVAVWVMVPVRFKLH